MKSTINIIGNSYSRLTVLEHVGYSEHGQSRDAMYKCLCVCGRMKNIRIDRLLSGKTKSCGCLIGRVSDKPRNSSMPLDYTPRFRRIWLGIKKRCSDKGNNSYHRYGGRGIKVCNRWMDFKNFKDDMNQSYKEHIERFGINQTSIDRIDNNGDYEPSNCRWATSREQNSNRMGNVYLEFLGKKMTLQEWSRFTGINRETIQKRIRSRWNIYDILTRLPPSRTYRKVQGG